MKPAGKDQTMKPRTCLLFVVDSRTAHVFQCHRLESGTWKVDPLDSLTTQWEDYHEHGRPSSLGRGPAANAAQHFAGRGHEAEEEMRRFARDVSTWIASVLSAQSASASHVFAASRFLSPLRDALGTNTERVSLHEGEFTRLRPGALAEEPAVVEALNAARPVPTGRRR